MHEILLVHLENHEIARLKVAGVLDERGRPERMTHVTTTELVDAAGHTLSIYENVFVSQLPASRDKNVIIFDRDGRVFECNAKDVNETEHAGRHATAV